jgi:hypothetical protein
MDPPNSVYAQGMKSKTLVLALGLLLMPIMASGQSPDAGIVAATPSPAAQPARWRDGYIDWRGRKIIEPDWRMFKAENGAAFVVDMKSIVNISPDGLVVRVVAYLVEGDGFDPNGLITFAFDCKNSVEVVTRAPSERVRPVEARAKELACH